MFKKAVPALSLTASSSILVVQNSIKPFAGAGFGMENRIGFRGINLQDSGEFSFSNHLSGIVGVDVFWSNSVSKWSSTENEGAYFRQLTPSLNFSLIQDPNPEPGF